jgi:hypothetical protein
VPIEEEEEEEGEEEMRTTRYIFTHLTAHNSVNTTQHYMLCCVVLTELCAVKCLRINTTR